MLRKEGFRGGLGGNGCNVMAATVSRSERGKEVNAVVCWRATQDKFKRQEQAGRSVFRVWGRWATRRRGMRCKWVGTGQQRA
jgi:hypothetical protein